MKPFKILPLMIAAFAIGCVADQADHESFDQTHNELVVCPDDSSVSGIDVSVFQGTVNWSAVAASGIDFAIARVSDGTNFIDGTFPTNYAGIKQAGMVRGSYQFFRPGQDPIAQAQIMVQAVGQLSDGDLPPVIDVETADGQSDATVVTNVRRWLDYVENATGRRPIIYAAAGFWNTLSGTSEFADYPLWVANYGATCPYLPNTWSDFSIWQFTDSGSVPGIAGPVDTNIFNGSPAQLQQLASSAAPPPAEQLPIEVYWSRQADGSYDLRALASQQVDRVTYLVDGFEIGSASRQDGFNFPDNYTFTLEKQERFFEVLGYDSANRNIARGVGLFDVTSSFGLYVKQMGDALYEIGMERAPSGVAAIEVRADGYLLSDIVSGTSRSSRKAVRTPFNQLGERTFAISTFNADGSQRGTLYRTFTLK